MTNWTRGMACLVFSDWPAHVIGVEPRGRVRVRFLGGDAAAGAGSVEFRGFYG